jgi:hypothetical protein
MKVKRQSERLKGKGKVADGIRFLYDPENESTGSFYLLFFCIYSNPCVEQKLS